VAPNASRCVIEFLRPKMLMPQDSGSDGSGSMTRAVAEHRYVARVRQAAGDLALVRLLASRLAEGLALWARPRIVTVAVPAFGVTCRKRCQ
jgi:hypothetical protein